MSESAFGVDHGEISKATHFTPPGVVRAGRAYQRAANVADKATSTPMSVKGLGRATSRGAGHVANGITRGSLKMANNPGKTGAAVLGTGAAGAAYGGKKLYNREPKKTAPRGM